MSLEVDKQPIPTQFAQGAGRGNWRNNNRIHEESKRRAREWFDKHPYRNSQFKETYE